MKAYDITGFKWEHIHTRAELKAFYERILPGIRIAARANGYALGVHGSMTRDLDLIAAPWVKQHATPTELARAVQYAACGLVMERYEWDTSGVKPCGRVSVSFPICWTERGGEFGDPHEKSTGHIDLSVMPDLDEAHAQRSADFARRVAVEQRLLDVYAGKLPPLTRQECREIAEALGVPSEYRR